MRGLHLIGTYSGSVTSSTRDSRARRLLTRPVSRARPNGAWTSARMRILGWYVALLGVALIAALLIQRQFLLEQAEADVEMILDQEVGELDQLSRGVDPEAGEPFGDDVEAIFDTFLARNVPLEGEGLLTYVSGSVYKSNVTGEALASLPIADEWSSVTESRRGALEDPGLGRIRYVAVPLAVSQQGPGGVFVASVLMDNRLGRIDDAVRLGALVYGSIFLLASALAWIAAGVILRPLREFANTARSIEETEDLSRRIAVEGQDEIAELGRTFNSMLDRLDQAFASQRQFIDDASHELRTPITVIRGNLEVMGDDLGEREETIALVTDELDRMSRIVDDLLDLANAEQPDFIKPGPVDLAEFTAELLAKAEVLDDRPWKLDRVEHVVATADRHRLNQAMMNLIKNAAEYSPRESPIYVGSELSDGFVKIWVRDEGDPIAEDERERIFDRFSRVDSERRRGGAGLGLAIVKAIVEGHDGDVTLESGEERGNTFVVSLPVQPVGTTR